MRWMRMPRPWMSSLDMVGRRTVTAARIVKIRILAEGDTVGRIVRGLLR